MKKAELILTGIAILGMCLKIFLIPWGTIFMVLSVQVLAMLYIFLGFLLFNDIPLRKISLKEVPGIRIMGTIGAGIAIAITGIGILYKVMLWPGASIVLNAGLASLLVVGVFVSIQYAPYSSRILKRAVPYFITGLFLMFFSDRIFLDFAYRNHPAYIEAVKAWKQDPNNEALHEKMREERINIDREEFIQRHKERGAQQ